MKPINFEQDWTKDGNDFTLLGKEVITIDLSEAYNTDIARVYKQGNKFTTLFGNGCSCWDGRYEGWTNLTKPELKKLATRWASPNYNDHRYNYAEAALGRWLLENWKSL